MAGSTKNNFMLEFSTKFYGGTDHCYSSFWPTREPCLIGVDFACDKTMEFDHGLFGYRRNRKIVQQQSTHTLVFFTLPEIQKVDSIVELSMDTSKNIQSKIVGIVAQAVATLRVPHWRCLAGAVQCTVCIMRTNWTSRK